MKVDVSGRGRSGLAVGINEFAGYGGPPRSRTSRSPPGSCRVRLDATFRERTVRRQFPRVGSHPLDELRTSAVGRRSSLESYVRGVGGDRVADLVVSPPAWLAQPAGR